MITNMQDTSLDAWSGIIQSLGPKQQIVFEALQNNPASNRTLSKRIGWEINRITGRVNELRKKGLVKRMFIEYDGNRPVIVWGVSL